MASFNRILLVGNLTRDPEVRFTPGGMAIANGGIATNRRTKRGAEYVDVPTFFDYKIFGTRAESFAKHHKKGGAVFLEGTLTTESWEDKKTGEVRSKMILDASNWEFVGGPRKEGPEEDEEDGPRVEPMPRDESTGFPWEKRKKQ
jgi:single-strand DNA-binding protein